MRPPVLRTAPAALLTLAMLPALLSGCTESIPAENGGDGDGYLGGGDRNPCAGTTRSVQLGWTDTSELGSAAAAFAGSAGTCTAPFTWDASSLNDRVVEPRTAK